MAVPFPPAFVGDALLYFFCFHHLQISCWCSTTGRTVCYIVSSHICGCAWGGSAIVDTCSVYCTMYSVEEETDCHKSSLKSASWGANMWSSVGAWCWVAAESSRGAWASWAGSAAFSPYWMGQAILGFTKSHRFGFTKVSDGQKFKGQHQFIVIYLAGYTVGLITPHLNEKLQHCYPERVKKHSRIQNTKKSGQKTNWRTLLHSLSCWE